MTPETTHSSARTYLKHKFEERVRKNRAYSLRAFARAAGIAPSYMSSLFSGTKHLSIERAEEISTRLRLSDEDRAYFVQLVELEHASHSSLQTHVWTRLQALRLARERTTLDQWPVSLLSKWYYPAILALTDLNHGQLNEEIISRRLRIPLEAAREAIGVLARLGWLVEGPRGIWRRSMRHVLLKAEATNAELCAYHEAMLRLTARALHKHAPVDRITRTETLAINKAQLAQVRRLTEEFIESVVGLSQQGERTDVFHLNLNFFNLTPEEK